MSELEFNAIFSKRLKYYLNKYDMTQSELAKRLVAIDSTNPGALEYGMAEELEEIHDN